MDQREKEECCAHAAGEEQERSGRPLFCTEIACVTRVEWGARREIMRYKLIPRAVAYYTGEAAEEEGDEEDDYDDEDDEARHCASQSPHALLGG